VTSAKNDYCDFNNVEDMKKPKCIVVIKTSNPNNFCDFYECVKHMKITKKNHYNYNIKSTIEKIAKCTHIKTKCM